MRILVTGSTGFIGSALVDALLDRGHSVVAGIHRASEIPANGPVDEITLDFMRDTDPETWIPRLAGVDVVVNTVGILREGKNASFRKLHEQTPIALFRACEHAGVARCIQVSALGADVEAVSAYHRTKYAADEVLRESSLAWTIVQPSLVIGPESPSTQLFATLASMPVIPLVGRGEQGVQPIAIDDLVALLVRLIERRLACRETIAAVGPDPLSLRELLQGLRIGMGFPHAPCLTLPVPLIRLAAHLGDWTGHGALSSETLAMLLRGNTAASDSTHKFLARSPADPRRALSAEHGLALRAKALSLWLRPLTLWALAVMWISAGVVSWLYARDLGPGLLRELWLPELWLMPLFAGACVVNIVLGVSSVVWPSRPLWVVQLAIIVFYSVVLSVVSPALWQDPFGALVKNLPIAVLLIGLMNTETVR